MSSVICLLRGLVLSSCVFLFVVLLNLCFHLLFNIIGSSPAWFVSEKKYYKRRLSEESSPVPAAPTNARNKWRSTRRQRRVPRCRMGEWPRFYQGGRKPRKVRGQLERREEQVLHSHTEKTPSLRVKYSEHGTGLHALNWIMIVAPSYITLSA